MAPSKTTLTLLAIASLAAQSAAHPEFRQKIPNALNVKGVAAIGHTDPEGGGARNKFGLAFAANELTWTVELCKADSDGDGQTNGQELGDPCCEWKEGATPKFTTGVSAPGDATSKADPSLWANVKCDGAASNATGSSNSTTTTAPSAGGAATTTTAPSATTKAPSAAATPAPTPKSGAASVASGVAAIAFAAVTTAVAFL